MAIEIGVVEDVQLDAFGTPPQEQKRELGRADDVFADEVVETVREGSLHLRFLDNTDFRLGSSAKVQLDTFVYDPAAKAGELGINLGQGIFRMVTGDMPSEAITINTPIATMGVRGTDWVGLLTANAFVIFVVKGSIWVKPLFGDNIQEYIVNALETVSVSLSGRVTFGVDRPEFDPGLGTDLVALLGPVPAAGEPLGPGGDGIFFDGQGSLLPFNPANLFRLVQVILERAAPNDGGGGTELPEEFAFAVVPGNSTDSNILFNALFGPTQDGTPAPVETPTPVTVIVLVTTPEGTVTPVAVTITPTDDGGTDVVVVPVDPGGPELFTPGDDDVDLSDIDQVFSLLNIDPGSPTALDDLDDLIFNDDLNISDALAGDDIVVLPDDLDEFRLFLDIILFDPGFPFDGGPGNDLIIGGNAFDIIAGGIGSTDTLYGEGDADQLYGDLDGDLEPDPGTALTGGTDLLYGGDDDDAIYGDAGNDISATTTTTGPTTAIGGADTIYGDGGDDDLYGDAGNNLTATSVGSLATTGGGDDTLYGGDGDDELYGDAGNDFLRTGDPNLSGGDDMLFGGIGTDTLYGDAGGNDGLSGGDDTLFGGEGNDVLYGGSGRDSLFGNTGSDDIFGQEEADVFFYQAGDGGIGGGAAALALADVITGFEDGVDRIDLFGGLGFNENAGSFQGFARFLPISQFDGSSNTTGVLVIRDDDTGADEILAVIQGIDIQLLTVADIVLP